MKQESKQIGQDTDKALVKAAKPNKKPRLPKTEDPIAEKDEVKAAEDELRQRMDRKYSKKRGVL